jgi:hypothetical protein
MIAAAVCIVGVGLVSRNAPAEWVDPCLTVGGDWNNGWRTKVAWSPLAVSAEGVEAFYCVVRTGPRDQHRELPKIRMYNRTSSPLWFDYTAYFEFSDGKRIETKRAVSQIKPCASAHCSGSGTFASPAINISDVPAHATVTGQGILTLKATAERPR